MFRASVICIVSAIICLALGIGSAAGQATPSPTFPATAQGAASAAPALTDKIMYRSTRTGVSQIFVMNADGTNVQQLTWGQGSYSSSWSPDGERIAYSSAVGNDAELFIMNADGSNQTQITHDKQIVDAVSWSPDGKHIAYSSGIGNDVELFVMNADGSNQTQITHNKQFIVTLSWSPDGKHIAFELQDENTDKSQIHIIDADGSHESNLSNNIFDESYPGWTLDGLSILFSSDRGVREQPTSYDFHLDLMNLDGSNFRRFSDVKCASDAHFSPDGQKVAYVNICENNREIHLIDTQGEHDVKLTDLTSLIGSPRWLNDGQHLVFDSESDGKLNLYLIDTDGSNMIQLTKDSGFNPVVQPNNLRVHSTPEATTISATVAGIQSSNP